MIRKLLLSVLFLLLSFFTFGKNTSALTITTIRANYFTDKISIVASPITTTSTGGNWNDASSWIGGIVPTATDDVVIASGATITSTGTINAKTLTINGTLIVSGTVTLNSITQLTINGFLTFADNTSNIHLPSGTAVKVNSPGKVDDSGGCSNNVAIYIGSTKIAACKGNGGGAVYDFTQFNNNGGTINAVANSNSPVCQNGTINLIGSFSGSAGTTTSGGSTTGVNYSWSTKAPDGTTTTSNAKNYNLTASQSGSYTAILTCKTYYGTDLSTSTSTIIVVSQAFSINSVTVPIEQCLSSATVTIQATPAALPIGNYTVTYSRNDPWAINLSASMTVTTAGTGTFTATGLTNAGNAGTTITVTNLASGSCSNAITTNNVSNTFVMRAALSPPTLDGGGFASCSNYVVQILNQYPNATNYYLDVSTSNTFTTYLAGYQNKDLGTTFQHTIIGLTPGTQYHYRFRSANVCGTTANSAVGSFTAPAATGGPTPTFTTAPSGNVCANTSVTYTTQSGKSNYQWTVPGNAGNDYTISGGGIGASNNSVTLTWLTNGSKTVTVNYINSGCLGSTQATNTVTVNSNSTAGVSIASSPAGAICAGNEVTFTATPTNGGTSPSYQWKVNGTPTGTNSAIFKSTTLANGNTVTCTMTSNQTCATPNPATSNTIPMVVTPDKTISLSSASGTNIQTTCINTPISDITYATNGASGATVTGLPAGMTWSFVSNIVKITGAPSTTVGSPFNYVVNLAGCGTATATGTITVTPDKTISLSSATGSNIQTSCINSPITNITYTTNGATNATVTGLPAGMTWSFVSNVVTILGSPSTTVGSPFNYTVNLTGCGTATATGTITVTPDKTISLTSATGTNIQTTCINTPITDITYATNGATAATVTGLPTGMTWGFVSNVVTISGNPSTTVGSPFNYTVNLTGCGIATATGTITVNPTITPLVSIASSATGAICSGTEVTFTATSTNAGTTPFYQWKVNGTATGTNSTIFKSTTLVNGDIVTCAMTSNEACVTASPATSNTITMTVTPSVPASVTIKHDYSEDQTQLTICQGTHVRFTAHPTNEGNNPTYQWYNGSTLLTETSDSYLAYNVTSTDAFRVIMTSNASPCLTGSPATSNTISFSVTTTDRGRTHGGGDICYGAIPGKMTLTNFDGPGDVIYSYQNKIVRWEYSIDGNQNWTAIPGTDKLIEYTPTTPLYVNTTFRAVAQTGSCSEQYAIETGFTVLAPTAISSPSINGQSTCQNDPFSAISVTASGTNPDGQNDLLYQWYSTTQNNNTSGSAITGATTNAYTPLSTTSGILYYYCIVNGKCGTATSAVSGAFITIAAPVAPTIVSKLQPTCTTPTGSVTLSGLPATGILRSLLGNSTTATFTITGTTTTISGLVPGKYKFAIDNPCGAPLYSAEVTLLGNIWDGAKWSKTNDLTLPTADDLIIFEGDYTAVNDIKACSCTINSGNVIITGGKTLNITNEITVNGGTLTFSDDASLLQTNPTALNSGAINYQRKSVDIRLADYVYWSSPVKNFKLGLVSPLTSAKYLYSNNGTNWVNEPSSRIMAPGKGYIVRGPDNITNGVRTPFMATFTGTPNNGNIDGEIVKKDQFYLVGNPYPSSLDADAFIDGNRSILEGTLYFWTHNTPVVLGGAYEYSSDDYATYNLSGGSGTRTAAPSGNDDDTGDNKNNESAPSGFIGAGQSFFAGIAANGQIKFENGMRAGGNTNGQFFKPGTTAKTTALEKHRVWLNMTNAKGAFKQILVGYIQGASNAYERFYDGTTLDGNKYVDFYSVNDGNNLVIQGRALPFADTDTVPLGYRSTLVGDFTIGIDHADGKLNTQSIYLEDKTTGKILDLTAANYTFTTEKGTFNDRFVLRYTNKTLGTGDFENIENGLLVSVKDKVIKVTSAKETIKEVTVFDISGRLLYNKKKVGSTEFEISNLQSANQVLLVKVILENDYVATKKIIFN